jgi:acyl-CoA thioesterase-2
MSRLRQGTTVAELLELTRTGPDQFRGRSAGQPDWIYGGQVVAQALAAATATVPADRLAHTVHADYLRRGKGGVPVDYAVTRLRDGGAFSSRQVTAVQDGRLLFVALASFHTGEDLFGHQLPIPDVAPPDAVPPPAALDATDPGWPRWLPGRPDLDVRRTAVGPRHGKSLIWARVTVPLPDDPRLHACAMAYLSDLTLLASIRMPYEPEPGMRRRWRMMTLNHAVWFHRPLRADDWLLLDQHSPTAAAGRGLTTASVFAPDGAMVGSLAQEGVGRPLT